MRTALSPTPGCSPDTPSTSCRSYPREDRPLPWVSPCGWPSRLPSARPPPWGLPPAHNGQNTQHRPEVTHSQERTLSLKSEVPYPDHDGESNQASLTPHLTPVVHPLPSLTLPFPDPSDTADTLFGFTDFISLGK